MRFSFRLSIENKFVFVEKNLSFDRVDFIGSHSSGKRLSHLYSFSIFFLEWNCYCYHELYISQLLFNMSTIDLVIICWIGHFSHNVVRRISSKYSFYSSFPWKILSWRWIIHWFVLIEKEINRWTSNEIIFISIYLVFIGHFDVFDVDVISRLEIFIVEFTLSIQWSTFRQWNLFKLSLAFSSIRFDSIRFRLFFFQLKVHRRNFIHFFRIDFIFWSFFICLLFYYQLFIYPSCGIQPFFS